MSMFNHGRPIQTGNALFYYVAARSYRQKNCMAGSLPVNGQTFFSGLTARLSSVLRAGHTTSHTIG